MSKLEENLKVRYNGQVVYLNEEKLGKVISISINFDKIRFGIENNDNIFTKFVRIKEINTIETKEQVETKKNSDDFLSNVKLIKPSYDDHYRGSTLIQCFDHFKSVEKSSTDKNIMINYTYSVVGAITQCSIVRDNEGNIRIYNEFNCKGKFTLAEER